MQKNRRKHDFMEFFPFPSGSRSCIALGVASKKWRAGNIFQQLSVRV